MATILALQPLPPLACRRCRMCGYDLSGRPDTERCSECGASHEPRNFTVVGAPHINPVAAAIGIAAAVAIGSFDNALSSGQIPGEYVGLGAGILIGLLVIPRLRISAVLGVTSDGLSLRRGFGRAPLRRWDHIDRITLQASPHQPYRLTRTARASIDRWQLSLHMKEPPLPGFTRRLDAVSCMHELLPPQAEFLCSHCGYDRSGAPDSDCCPECGAPATRARWIVRGQKVRSPLMPAGIFAVVMLLVFHHLYSIPPEMFLPLQAVTLVFMIWMLRRPYRAILCAAPDGLSLRWGFGPAILMPAESIRSVRFFVAPGLRLQRTGRTEPTRWMLEIVGTPGANLVAGPVQPSAGPRTWSARFVGFFRPWGLPPALVVNGSRDEVMQLERAISTVIGDDPTRHPVVPSETPS